MQETRLFFFYSIKHVSELGMYRLHVNLSVINRKKIIHLCWHLLKPTADHRRHMASAILTNITNEANEISIKITSISYNKNIFQIVVCYLRTDRNYL